LFDIGPEPPDVNDDEDLADDDNPDVLPREVCIPDFIIRAEPVPPGAAVVIVETMGFARREYRERKERIHPAMSTALNGAPVKLHDFHEPVGLSQVQRNDRFWKSIRWAITGPERN